MKNKVPGQLIFACAAVIAGLVVFSACQKPPSAEEQRKQDGYRELQNNRDEFTQAAWKKNLVSEPYIKGKIAYYEYANAKWSDVNVFGPGYKNKNEIKDIIALTLDEVKTVVLKRNCTQAKTGTYTTSDAPVDAYTETCEIALIDPATSTIYYEKNLEGKLDEKTNIYGNQTKVVADVTGEQIVDFLAALPKK